MAPEVLAKGQAYDSSADWFSFGCMLYKLLKGHSPFRHHKTKDKHEIDRMTMTSVSVFPPSHLCHVQTFVMCKPRLCSPFRSSSGEIEIA